MHMDSRIKTLQEKYWRAETTPKEEKLLKELVSADHDQSAEINYFKSLTDQKQLVSEYAFQHPKRRIRGLWYTIAASFLIGLMVVGGLMQRQPSQSNYNMNDPETALEITRQALMMVSTGLNEGKNYSATQLQQINKPKNILANYNTNNQ